MKLFFDECLDPTLTQIAIDGGFEATCSRDMGMLSIKDWDLSFYLVEHDYILVTNNSKDFRGKMVDPEGKPGHLTKEIHPGLICLNASKMTAKLQIVLFREALDTIAANAVTDLMNQVVEINYDDATDMVIATVYAAPA